MRRMWASLRLAPPADRGMPRLARRGFFIAGLGATWCTATAGLATGLGAGLGAGLAKAAFGLALAAGFLPLTSFSAHFLSAPVLGLAAFFFGCALCFFMGPGCFPFL